MMDKVPLDVEASENMAAIAFQLEAELVSGLLEDDVLVKDVDEVVPVVPSDDGDVLPILDSAGFVIVEIPVLDCVCMGAIGVGAGVTGIAGGTSEVTTGAMPSLTVGVRDIDPMKVVGTLSVKVDKAAFKEVGVPSKVMTALGCTGSLVRVTSEVSAISSRST